MKGFSPQQAVPAKTIEFPDFYRRHLCAIGTGFGKPEFAELLHKRHHLSPTLRTNIIASNAKRMTIEANMTKTLRGDGGFFTRPRKTPIVIAMNTPKTRVKMINTIVILLFQNSLMLMSSSRADSPSQVLAAAAYAQSKPVRQSEICFSTRS